MSLLYKDGSRLSRKDKIVYLGVINVFLYSVKETNKTSKFKKLFLKLLRKLNNEDRSHATKVVNDILNSFIDKYEGQTYERSIVLRMLVSFDKPTLNELGFSTDKFLNLECCTDTHPSIEARNTSDNIVKYIESKLGEENIMVKRIVPRRDVTGINITRADTAFVNMTLGEKKKMFVSTLKLDNWDLIYYPKVLIYCRKEEYECGTEYMVNDDNVIGTGGDIVSNVIKYGSREDEIIGIKHMDDDIYIFTNKANDAYLHESILNMPKGYRYTIELTKHLSILIHRWLNLEDYLDTYVIQLSDLASEKPITAIKKNGYKYELIPPTIYRKAGLKDIDQTRSFTIDEKDGIRYVLIKHNGNSIMFKNGKKEKLGKDITYVLNDGTSNRTKRTYVNQKILL